MPSRPASRLLVTDVLFRGRRDAKILRMAIDTGATTTVIPPKVAVAIGCDPTRSKRKVSIITASGTEYLPVVTVSWVACLGQTARALPVAYHDLPPQSTVDGLLGLDFLTHLPAFRRFQQALLQLARE